MYHSDSDSNNNLALSDPTDLLVKEMKHSPMCSNSHSCLQRDNINLRVLSQLRRSDGPWDKHDWFEWKSCIIVSLCVDVNPNIDLHISFTGLSHICYDASGRNLLKHPTFHLY